MWDDELRIARDRHAGLLDDLDRLDTRPPDCGVSLVVQTVTVTSYPSTAGKYVGVQAIDPGGTEAEGQAGTFGTPGGTFFALVLPGHTVPAVGTKCVVSLVGGRWVFEF